MNVFTFISVLLITVIMARALDETHNTYLAATAAEKSYNRGAEIISRRVRRLRADPSLNVVDDFGAKGDAIFEVFSVTVERGEKNVYLSQAKNHRPPEFSVSDIGKPIEIGGAGQNGEVLISTVASVRSPNQITITDAVESRLDHTEDGVVVGHDDTDAFSAAFSESAARPIYVPCTAVLGRVYRITSPLKVPSGGYVYGRIGNPYFFLPPNWLPSNPPPPCNLIVADGYSRSWSGARGGIVLGGANHIEGLSVSMMNLGSPVPPPIYGSKPWVELRHNFLVGGRYSIEADYGEGSQNQGWEIASNDLAYVSEDCIRLNGSTDNMVHGNWVHGCHDAGINLVGAGGTDVMGNVFEDCGITGVNIYGDVTNTHFLSNKIDNNGFWGIEVVHASGDVTFVGNSLYGNGKFDDGANWYIVGRSTITLTSLGNSYAGKETSYQANATGDASIGERSAFVEVWPPGKSGIYNGAAESIFQPKLLVSPNNLSGPYADDRSAGNAGLPIGAEYYDESGFRRKRIK